MTRCVESVLAQSVTDFECFIVDNGSSDDSIANLPALDDRFTILEMGDNLGFSAANNHAARLSHAEWLALLNPDAFAHVDWLEKGLAARSILSNTSMIGSTQYMADDRALFDGLGDEYHAFGLAWRAGHLHPVTPIVTREAFGPCGAGAFYKKDVFLKLGGFDESFFCYHEDVDLAYRMRRAGYVCVQSADAKIDHVSSGIAGRASDFAVYHGVRNRIWTFFKNTPRPILPLLILPHLATCMALLFWSSIRAGRFKPTLRGTWAGFFTSPKTSPPRLKRQVSILTLLKAFGWNPRKVIRRDIVKTNAIEPPSNTLSERST